MSPLTALVTGASRGIGRAIALHLAARGCAIGVHYHTNRAAAVATLQALPGAGHALLSAGLNRADETVRLWREATVALGGVDILINNAGTYGDHAPLATSFAAWQDAWQQTLAANLVAPANLCHLAVNAMATTEPKRIAGTGASGDFGRGRIVNISSRGAFRGEPDAPAYGASKAGLNALSQSLAKAMAPHSIYVFCLAPGWVETDMAADHLAGPRGTEILAQHPLGRVASADEIARAAVFCALDAPPAMTGAILDVNGASYLRT